MSMRHLLSPDLAVVDAFAVGAHAGQSDKNGDPYIGHPRAVAKLVRQVPSFTLLDDWQRHAAVIVALLHDVLEDTQATRADMISIGIPVPMVDIVQLLTFTAGDDREVYYARIVDHPVARVVKIADVAHNTSRARTVRLPEDVQVRLSIKYGKAIDALTDATDPDRAWLVDPTR